MLHTTERVALAAAFRKTESISRIARDSLSGAVLPERTQPRADVRWPMDTERLVSLTSDANRHTLIAAGNETALLNVVATGSRISLLTAHETPSGVRAPFFCSWTSGMGFVLEGMLGFRRRLVRSVDRAADPVRRAPNVQAHSKAVVLNMWGDGASFFEGSVLIW